MDQEAFRHVPYDIEVEQGLLGAMICDMKHFYRVSENGALKVDDFYDPLHQRIFTRIEEAAARNERVTPLSLHASMKTDAGLQEIGGHGYLARLAQAAAAAPNARDLARILVELAKRRELIRIGEDLVNAAYEQPDDKPASTAADEASEALYSIAHKAEQGRGPEPLIDVVRRAADGAEYARTHPDKAKISTGIPGVDKALGGLFPRHLHVVGAPPSAGKSGLTAQIGLSAAAAQHTTLMFSIEMAAEEVGARYLAFDTKVTSNRIAEGRTSEAEVTRIAEATRNYDSIPFFVDEITKPSVAQIRARCQAVKRRHGSLSLVIVDHLRLIRPADPRAPEHERYDQIVDDLKTMAKDLDLCVLLVATLNRAFYQRTNPRPMLSDLYGASAIEYHADHVWFLHREEYFLERNVPPETDQKAYVDWASKMEKAKGKAELFAAKRRGGPLGSVVLNFDAPYVRFTDPIDEPASAEPNQEDIKGLLP